MNTVRLIPCLDVDRGRVVKGTNFVELVDAGDPAELAARYDNEGADEIVFLDITASSENRTTMVDVVHRTAEQVFIPLTVGGGVANLSDARRLLRAGADKVSVNTAAVERPELINDIAEEFGTQCVVVAVDAKRRSGGESFEVYTHGGREASGLDVMTWTEECAQRGAGELLVTSMDRDGTKLGYDLELIAAIARSVDLPLVASGGVGELADLADGARCGADGLLAASIFHFRSHSIREAKEHLAAAGFIVRDN